jgi:hypothetical protein
MFALDLFNTRFEQDLNEGAVDKLEARRIEDLNAKMDDLLARARTANPQMKAALKREFDKVKEERDSYYKIREGGIPGNIPADKIPGKEDLLKGKGRSYYEAGIPGSVPTEKIPGKEDLLKGKGRNYYEAAQKKNSEEVTEDQRLNVGDPVVVTAPNDFEGKTGEIYDFSPSGSFIIVDLYNYGKHSMHLSDVEYNQYADDQAEEDDWYDDGAEDTLEETNNPKLDALIKNIQARMKKDDYKRPEIMKRVAQMVAQADPTVQDAMATAQQLVQQYGQSPAPAQTHIGGMEISPPKKLKPGETHQGINAYNQALGQAPIYKTNEGWSDAIVARRTGQPRTPYSIYIKGKKWKDFENDDHAENVANKLRAKFKADGRDPGVITIAPTDMSEGVADVADQVKKVFKDKSGKPVGEIGIDPESSPGNGEWYVHHYATGYSVVGFDSVAEAKRELMYVHKHPDAVDGHPSTKEQGMAEGATDYSKRRQRERDVDAGKPVAKQRQSKMTDYQKRRAQQKKEMELGEDDPMGGATIAIGQPAGATADLAEEQDTSGVERAILHRIMVANTDLLMKFGPEKVMQAAEEVAYNVGDVDEIGSSDISAYVHQVKQILGVPEELDEKWSQKYKSSINCANPKGFSQKAHCAGRKK